MGGGASVEQPLDVQQWSPELAQAVKSKQAQNNLTQGQVAVAADVDGSVFSRFLKGQGSGAR